MAGAELSPRLQAQVLDSGLCGSGTQTTPGALWLVLCSEHVRVAADIALQVDLKHIHTFPDLLFREKCAYFIMPSLAAAMLHCRSRSH